jgi:hypothetical protein
MRKRQRSRTATPPDGFRWFRNWIALKTGGYHYEWRIARLVAGQVEVYGPVLTLDADDRYLHRVIWGPAIIPPSVEGTEELALSLVQGRHRSRPHRQDASDVPEKFLAVARRITAAFVETSDDLRTLYANSPERLEEVIRRVAVLIQEATE